MRSFNSCDTNAEQLGRNVGDEWGKRIYGVAALPSTASPTHPRRTDIQGPWLRHEETEALRRERRLHIRRISPVRGQLRPGPIAPDQRYVRCPPQTASRFLAIAATDPTIEMGSGYFQETQPEISFASCNHYCHLVSSRINWPRTLEIAIRDGGVATRRFGGCNCQAMSPDGGTRARRTLPRGTGNRNSPLGDELDNIRLTLLTWKPQESRSLEAPAVRERTATIRLQIA